MGEATTASAASLRRPRPPHHGVVGSCTPGTAAVGMANGEKVCTGFAKLSPARGRVRGELSAPSTRLSFP